MTVESLNNTVGDEGGKGRRINLQRAMANIGQHLYFKGGEVTFFLQKFETLYQQSGLEDSQFGKTLVFHTKESLFNRIQDMSGFKKENWELLKKEMKATFIDEERAAFSLYDLDRFVKKQKKKGKIDNMALLSKVYLGFTRISTELKAVDTLSWQEETREFLSLFPRSVQKKLDTNRKINRMLASQENKRNGGAEILVAPLLKISEVKSQVREIFYKQRVEGEVKRSKKGKDGGKRVSKNSRDSSSESDSDDSSESSSDSSDEDDDLKSRYKDLLDSDSSATTTQTSTQKELAASIKRTNLLERELSRTTTSVQAPNSLDSISSLTQQLQDLKIQIATLSSSNRDPPPHFNQQPAYSKPAYGVQNNNYTPNGPPPPQLNGNSPATPPNSIPFICHWCSRVGHTMNRAGQPNCNSLVHLLNLKVIDFDNGRLSYKGEAIGPGTGKNLAWLEKARGAREEGKPPLGSFYHEYEWEAPTLSSTAHTNNVMVAEYGHTYQSISRNSGVHAGYDYTVEDKRVRSDDESRQDPAKRQHQDFVQDIRPELSIPRGPFNPKQAVAPPNRQEPNLRPYEQQKKVVLPLRQEKENFRQDEPMNEGATTRTRGPAQFTLKSGFDSTFKPDRLLNSILQENVTLPLRSLFESSPLLVKALEKECQRKRVPISAGDVNIIEAVEGEELTTDFNGEDFISAAAQVSYAGPLGKISIVMEGEPMLALIDTGSQINLISEDIRKRLGLGLRKDGIHTMRGAGGGKMPLEGSLENQTISVGGVELRQHFYSTVNPSFAMILGVPFLKSISGTIKFDTGKDSTMEIKHEGRRVLIPLLAKGGYLVDIPGEERPYGHSDEWESQAIELFSETTQFGQTTANDAYVRLPKRGREVEEVEVILETIKSEIAREVELDSNSSDSDESLPELEDISRPTSPSPPSTFSSRPTVETLLEDVLSKIILENENVGIPGARIAPSSLRRESLARAKRVKILELIGDILAEEKEEEQQYIVNYTELTPTEKSSNLVKRKCQWCFKTESRCEEMMGNVNEVPVFSELEHVEPLKYKKIIKSIKSASDTTSITQNQNSELTSDINNNNNNNKSNYTIKNNNTPLIENQNKEKSQVNENDLKIKNSTVNIKKELNKQNQSVLNEVETEDLYSDCTDHRRRKTTTEWVEMVGQEKYEIEVETTSFRNEGRTYECHVWEQEVTMSEVEAWEKSMTVQEQVKMAQDFMEGFRTPEEKLFDEEKENSTSTHNAYTYDVNFNYITETKYKPVGKKTLPITTPLLLNPNASLKRPPFSRNPYETPLSPHQGPVVYSERVTQERLAKLDFGPPGWLTKEERNLLEHVLVLRGAALSFSDSERGKLKETYANPYVFATEEHEPWRQRPATIPQPILGDVIKLIKDRMASGLYEDSTSTYSGRWFVVQKKNGKLRLVHDLQPLNSVTYRDAGYPPHVEEFLEEFMGCTAYGMLDIFGGYDQYPLAIQSRDMTTFQTPLGPKRLTRLPQGYTNSVAVYQRMMTWVMAEEIPYHFNVFIDDGGIKGPKSYYNQVAIEGNPQIRQFIWEFAITFERILFRLEEAGLTASGEKLAVCVPEMVVVGARVSYEGRRIDQQKLNKIERFPRPTNVTELRGFLGVVTFVRIWIKNLAVIAKPLRKLTMKDVDWNWSVECEEAFTTLKSLVGKDILLAKLDYSEGAGEIILSVDSSSIAAGVGLFQVDSKGTRQPVRYESISFTPAESRYSQPKLELAGVAKALKKLQVKLWGAKFVLEVDALFLKQMISAPELPNAPMTRWLHFIQLFTFDVRHVPGKTHTLADGLSRARRDELDTEAQSLDGMIGDLLTLEYTRGIEEFKEKKESNKGIEYQVNVISKEEEEKIWLALENFISSKSRLEGISDALWKKIQIQAPNYFMIGSQLWKKRGEFHQLVTFDLERRKKFLVALHDEGGHRGRNETYRRLQLRCWWPGMSVDVKNYVKTCEECQLRKTTQEREARKPTQPRGLMDKIHFDAVHIKTGRFKYLIVGRDDLSGWVEAKALKRITSKAVTKFIEEQFILRFGHFRLAVVDGGPEFKKDCIATLEHYGIVIAKPAPYSPEGNGKVERGHGQLVDTLAKLSKGDKNWQVHLNAALFADRISTSRSTGFSAYELILGCQPVLPIDTEERTWLITDWSKILTRSDLLEARVKQLERREGDIRKALARMSKARLQSVTYLNKVNAHRTRTELVEGDYVLALNVLKELSMGRKLEDRWLGPYRVKEKLEKGSCLLEELDRTPMRKIFAAKLLKRFFPRGVPEVEVEEEEYLSETEKELSSEEEDEYEDEDSSN